MANSGQLTGMRGVYLVAAELSRRGLIASPTSRSAIGADVLATDQGCSRAFSVQVKTNARTFGFWLLSAKAKKIASPSHVYVFVNIRPGKAGESIEYYVVPSAVVAEKMVSGAEWHQLNLVDAKPYKDKWDIFPCAVAADLTSASTRTPRKRGAG